MKKLKETILSIIIWFSGIFAFLFWAILILLVSLFNTGKLFDLMLKLMCKNLVLFAGIRVKIKFVEKADYQKQYIIMLNHVNIFDPFLFFSRFPGRLRAIEEESHQNWPVYGWLTKKMGQIYINRKSGRKALESLKKAGEFIKSRKDFCVAILPEGTRTITGKLGNFKKGGFLLAIESELDILPIIQIGAYQIKKKGNWLIRPGKVELIFEKPISTKGYTKKNISELIKKTRDVYLKYVE